MGCASLTIKKGKIMGTGTGVKPIPQKRQLLWQSECAIVGMIVDFTTSPGTIGSNHIKCITLMNGCNERWK